MVMKQRIRLDELSQNPLRNFEQKYVHYVPDTGRFVFSKILGTEHAVETEEIKDGWHLVFLKKFPYLISHSTISFIAHVHGSNAWRYHVSENSNFLEICYSSRALGAKGTYFDKNKYSDLSTWIKSSAGNHSIFIGSKWLSAGKYYINTAHADIIDEIILTDLDTGPYPEAIYGFRPVVALSPKMYLIIDESNDGSTPKKGMLLEPADDYDPANFAAIKPASTSFRLYQEALEVLGEVSTLIPSQPIGQQLQLLEDIITSLSER